jgi:phosphoadenosine phosphosulfate reductase
MGDWREMYRLHAKLPAFKKRIAKSKKIIRDALERIKNPYAAISFGKDSMVLLHLLIQQKPDIPMVWSDRGEEAELPATYPFVEQVKQKYNINLHVIRPEMSMFEIYRQYGLPEIDEGVYRSIVKEINLVHTFGKYVRENSIDGYFQGLRADEARSRLMFAKRYGPLFERKRDGMTVCNPLLWWTARDIWAYIVAYDVPYHPEYDNDRFKSREQIRLSNWSGLYWAQEGRLAELRYYHPDLFDRLANEFPEVKSLV